MLRPTMLRYVAFACCDRLALRALCYKNRRCGKCSFLLTFPFQLTKLARIKRQGINGVSKQYSYLSFVHSRLCLNTEVLYLLRVISFCAITKDLCFYRIKGVLDISGSLKNVQFEKLGMT